MVATHGDVGTALRAIPLAIASVWMVRRLGNDLRVSIFQV